MTKKLVLLVMMFLGCTISLMAQNISGKVVDEKNNPLPYVSVVLQSVQDSSYVGGVATNPEGLFALPVKSDVEYALSVSYIGYVTVDRTCKAGDIGTIVMKEDAMMLEEVSVIASRTQHDANGYTVNLRSSEIAKGKQSSDALVFLPGVSNEDGSYKINGLPVSEIYVDGVKLTSSDELKDLPADMIDKVKVNYLAGSNQNEAMTGGTIEISLRQPPQGGYYGADITLGGIYYGDTRLRQYYATYNTFSFNHGWGGMLNIMYEPTYKTYDRTYHAVYNIGGQIYKTMCKDKLQLTLTFNALGDRRKYDRYANGNKITYNYTTPVQNIGISLVWIFSGGKSVNVNAVENGSQSFKEVKDIR